MLKPSPDYPDITAWAALSAYLLGYTFFGYLLAMPTPNLPFGAWLLVVSSVLILALAGALADRLRRSFILAAVGALLLTGCVAWAASLVGDKAFSGAVLGTIIWGLAWAIAESKPIAAATALALGWVAVVSWAASAAVFLAGVIFMFVSSSCPVIGERLNRYYGSSQTFMILTLAAGLGLSLGWIGQTVF